MSEGSELFSARWVSAFAAEWNADESFVARLRAERFVSTVAFGFPDRKVPAVALDVREGEAFVLEPGQWSKTLDWDLRALPAQWASWFIDPPGLLRLGMAYTGSSLLVRSGDYVTMIKNPIMAVCFVKSFELMARAHQKTR